MKRLSLVLLLAVVVACGGGGDSDPADPNQNQNAPMVVPDGTFTLTAVKTVDGCSRNDVWDGEYDLSIVDKTFTFGDFAGTWDPYRGFAQGEANRKETTTRNCTVAEYSLAYLTFKNKDTFQGTIAFKRAPRGSCPNLNGCSTTWIVNGTRVTP